MSQNNSQKLRNLGEFENISKDVINNLEKQLSKSEQKCIINIKESKTYDIEGVDDEIWMTNVEYKVSVVLYNKKTKTKYTKKYYGCEFSPFTLIL